MGEIIKLVWSFIYRHRSVVGLYGSYDDLFGELMVKVLKKINKYDSSKGKLSTYIYMICSKSIMSDIHNGRLGSSNEVSFEDLAVINEDGDTIPFEETIPEESNYEEESEIHILYEKVLRLLTTEAKMHFVDGMSIVEIAKKIGQSRTAVYNRINRCVNRIRYIKGKDFSNNEYNRIVEMTKIMNEKGCSEKKAIKELSLRKKAL